MSSKPLVAFLMPAQTWRNMFVDEDIRELSGVAAWTGPMAVSDLAGRAGDLDEVSVAVTGWGTGRLDAEALALLPKLRLVAHSAGSVKGLVSPALFQRGIRVTTAAHINAVPVAHFTVSMMVAMLKQVPWISQAFARGRRQDIDARYAHLRELERMSVGLVGASRVGREVIRLLKSYPRLTIKVYDPYLPQRQAEALGVQLATLEEVCSCEVVSLHAPSIPETRHMINARTLALMPDHAVLINTARGSLIDEAALIAEVRRRPLYVALDVTDPEPPTLDSPLRTEPNIILTPHIAGAMKQARLSMGRHAVEEALRCLRGQEPLAEVPAEALATQA